MTTTDTDTLTERIEVSAREVMRRSALIADVDLPAYLAAAVLPIVEAEVCKAKAEALREAARTIRAEAAMQRVREMHEPIPVTEYITACSCGWWSHDDCPHVRALDGDA